MQEPKRDWNSCTNFVILIFDEQFELYIRLFLGPKLVVPMYYYTIPPRPLTLYG